MDDDDDDDDGFPQVVGALSKGDRDVGGTLMDYYHTRGEREIERSRDRERDHAWPPYQPIKVFKSSVYTHQLFLSFSCPSFLSFHLIRKH